MTEAISLSRAQRCDSAPSLLLNATPSAGGSSEGEQDYEHHSTSRHVPYSSPSLSPELDMSMADARDFFTPAREYMDRRLSYSEDHVPSHRLSGYSVNDSRDSTPISRSTSPEIVSADETSPTIERARDFERDKKPEPGYQKYTVNRLANLPLSLLEYLKFELASQDPSTAHDQRAERITNFLSVPMALEQIIVFGICICLDAFLYTFTIQPLRFVLACRVLLLNTIARFSLFLPHRKRLHLTVAQKCDIVKGALIILACFTLHRITDASRMYHSVRGQETIKLYVIFNVLEIADRLCCSFGQDVMDSLLSRAALGRYHNAQSRLTTEINRKILPVSHTTVLFYQLVTLNVAINSYSNALLTLLMSNQFVEIKGAVFKKFEKENLFQMSCADIVERFQLGLMLAIIVIRNLIEIGGSTFSTLPTSYISISAIPSLALINRILTPAIIVLLSELIVDWLKHAFITKFNHIRPQVYARFIDVLSKDLVLDVGASSDTGQQPFVDQSPAVSRRLGFAAIPLGCLVVRVFFQILDMLGDDSHIDECAPRHHQAYSSWLAPSHVIGLERQAKIAKWLVLCLAGLVVWAGLVVTKLVIGINLRNFALSRLPSMRDRSMEDDLNARGRKPIGTSTEEQEFEDSVSFAIDNNSFDTSTKRKVKLEGNPDFKILSMENLSRFDIVKSRLY